MLRFRQFISLLLLLIPLTAAAVEVPPLSGRVNDNAGLLSPDTASRLEQRLSRFEREESTQIAILTVPSLQGDDIERFSIAVADRWKLGQQGKDNGVILIIARDERKVRIEVGMGLQGVLPDITAGQIIRNVMRPHLRNNDFDRAVTAGTEAVIAATRGEFKASAEKKVQKNRSGGISSFFTYLLFTGIAAAALGSVSRPLAGTAGAIGLPVAAAVSFSGISIVFLLVLAAVGLAAGLLIALLSGLGRGGGFGGGFFPGGGFGGGFSSGGDSGFSGGGGGFDGGGASGDW